MLNEKKKPDASWAINQPEDGPRNCDSKNVAGSSIPEDSLSCGYDISLSQVHDELLRYFLLPVDCPPSQMRSFDILRRPFTVYNRGGQTGSSRDSVRLFGKVYSAH